MEHSVLKHLLINFSPTTCIGKIFLLAKISAYTVLISLYIYNYIHVYICACASLDLWPHAMYLQCVYVMVCMGRSR